MSGGREAGVNAVLCSILTCSWSDTGKVIPCLLALDYTAVPKLFGTREQFRGRHFFLEDMDGLGRAWVENGFGMIQAHYIYCALYFYYYYINSTSYHKALDPGGWGPLMHLIKKKKKKKIPTQKLYCCSGQLCR